MISYCKCQVDVREVCSIKQRTGRNEGRWRKSDRDHWPWRFRMLLFLLSSSSTQLCNLFKYGIPVYSISWPSGIIYTSGAFCAFTRLYIVIFVHICNCDSRNIEQAL